MASVTLTSRELKNRSTGIDIFVPQYEHISGSFGGSVSYHVIVVTQLFYFKIPNKHKESDVVQFMIPHKYEIFEELCSKLVQKFPSVVFSSPPKKTFLISESVISDRRQYMEEVLQQIARTPKLACSSLVLEFLGAKKGNKDIKSDESQSRKDEEFSEKKSANDEVAEDEDLFASVDKTDSDRMEHNKDDEEDLLAVAQVSSATNPPVSRKGSSIFDTNDTENVDNDDVNNLFVPADANEKKINVQKEDNSELLNIEDDLDKLLTAKRKPPKPVKPVIPVKPVAKPRLKAKPDLKPKPTPQPRFAKGSAGEDELFGTVSSTIKGKKPSVTERKARSSDQNLFDQTKKTSFNRTASHGEETLDDIFNSPPQPSFGTTEDDDDLFQQRKGVQERGVQDMGVDDIASYIQQNMPSTDTKLDLF